MRGPVKEVRTVMVWRMLLLFDEGGSSGEVGTEVEVGKRRKVLRRRRFSRRNEAFGASVNLLDVVRILKGCPRRIREVLQVGGD